MGRAEHLTEVAWQTVQRHGQPPPEADECSAGAVARQATSPSPTRAEPLRGGVGNAASSENGQPPTGPRGDGDQSSRAHAIRTGQTNRATRNVVTLLFAHVATSAASVVRRRDRSQRVHAIRPNRTNRVSRNLASLFLSQLATWAIAIVMVVFVPHFLAASQFGVLQFATTFVSYFVLVAGLGTGTFLVKVVARDPPLLGVYVFNALLMKVVLAVSFSAVAIVLARSLGYPHQTFVIVEIACVGMILFLVNDVLGAGLQGIEQMGRPAAWTVVQAYVAAIVGLAVLAQGRDVVKFALVTTLAAAIPVVANAAHLRARLRGSMRLDLRVWRTIAIGGFPFLLGAGVLLIYGTIDIPLLQAMAGSATVGWYALAYAWVTPAAGFSSLVVKATLPSLSASAHTASHEFTELANNAIRLVMFVGLPASAGIALVAPDIFALFHYQASFWPAIPLIRILALHIPIVGMDMVLGTVLIANDKQRQWTAIGCVAAVVNVVANLFAIPLTVHAFHNGAIGAAVVTVATEGLMMVGAIRLRPAGVLNRATLSYIARCTLATLVMAATIIAVGGTSVVLKIAIGVLVYAGSALALRALSVRDLRSLALSPSQSPPHELERVEQ